MLLRSFFVLSMAPKKTSKKTEPAKSSGSGLKRKAGNDNDDDVVADNNDRKDQSNMITQLKAAKRVDNGKPAVGDVQKVELLSKYNSLSRFSDEKKALLESWRKDKSLGWWANYEERKGATTSTDTHSVIGYGSRLVNVIYQITMCVFSILLEDCKSFYFKSYLLFFMQVGCCQVPEHEGGG